MRLRPHFTALLSDEQGQDLVEYSLLLGLIALASIAAIRAAAVGVVNVFSSVGSTLTSAT